MKKIILIIGFVFCFNQCFATVDYLMKNKVTKELHVFETGRIICYDGLFWEPVFEVEIENQNREEELKKEGYKYTNNPYKIELFTFVLIISIAVLIKKKKLK